MPAPGSASSSSMALNKPLRLARHPHDDVGQRDGDPLSALRAAVQGRPRPEQFSELGDQHDPRTVVGGPGRTT